MTKFLIDYSLFNKLVNDDFATNIYILGAKLLEEPKKNKEKVTGGGIVSRRLRQLNKIKVIEKKEDNNYLIMSAKPVNIVPEKLFLSVNKSQLEQVLNDFNNNDLRFIGVTYFDLKSFKDKLEDNSDYNTITIPAVRLMLSELVKSINGFNDKIILIKENNALYALSRDSKIKVIPYKLPRELTPYEKFFTLESVNEEEFNEFFSLNEDDLEEFNKFFNNSNY